MMRIPRVHVRDSLQPGRALRLPERQSHYVARVLRLAPGSALVLFNGDGCDYAAEIVGRSRSGVDVRIDTRLPAVPPSALRVILVQGLSRGERMDQTLQKATELGVAAFQPVTTARSEVRLHPGKLEKRMLHWQSVVVAACEQCGRSDVPELFPLLTLSDWVQSDARGVRLVLEPGAARSLASMQVPGEVELLVGPEGGFEDRETDFLARFEVQPVRLGPRVLRTETAGPAALAVLQAMAGDLA